MKKSRRKIKKQLIFNLISIIFLLGCVTYYVGRLIYYYKESQKPVVYSDLLYERIIDENDTYDLKTSFIELNGIYRFVGNVNNNYVKYKGFLWRVIRINQDHSITMVSEDTITSLAYGSDLNTIILPYLNKGEDNTSGIFENALEDDKDLVKNKVCLDRFNDISIAGCYETTYDYKIGLLSLDDYLKAGANESYLVNETTFWTSNRYNSENVWYIASDGLVSNNLNNTKLGIRPVITLSDQTKVLGGEGISENPYLIDNVSLNKLTDAYIGNYVTFNDTLWRIVAKDKDKVKLVSTECIKNGEECLSIAYSNYSNKISTSDKTNLMYYLNKTYLNSLKDNALIVSGPFYTGTYSLTTNDYRTVLKNTANLKVGMLSVADLFAYEVPNTFLLTTDIANESAIFSVNANKGLYESMTTQKLNVRPVIYLKGDIEIKSGNGTYLSPLTLGGSS